MQRTVELGRISRCAPGCSYGHCKLMTEAWFTRTLSLERKRTERSRTPFVLVLLSIEALELNGDQTRVIHELVTCLSSCTRETDITGWYRDGAVLGTIFTEVGESRELAESVVSIKAKITIGLKRQFGQERSSRIHMSCHVFPEDWSENKPSGSVDAQLYPDLQERRTVRWPHSAGKRMIDIVLSGLALLFLLPVLVLIAAAVKLSSRGPVLFRQDRVGQFGRRFTFLKFRSMRVCHESAIHQQYVRKLITGDLGVPENGVFKIQNDPRVTRVGRFLRKTSLDELPQFWNVLVGDMSLVGPRPPLPYEVEVYRLWHRRRLLEAKPGITGLWQVNGRSHTCFDDMVRLDLHYSSHSSFWLDLTILLKTPAAVLAGDGAY